MLPLFDLFCFYKYVWTIKEKENVVFAELLSIQIIQFCICNYLLMFLCLN